MSSQKPSFLLSSISSMIVSEINDSLQEDIPIDKSPEIYCFNEEKYIEERPENFSISQKKRLRAVPTNKLVFDFIKSLKLSLDVTEDELLRGYIYINRMINKTNIFLTPTTWRDLDFTDINKFFYEIYPFCTLKEILELELNFVKNLDFKLFISKKLFTNYKIELETYSTQIKRHQTFIHIPTFKLIKYKKFKSI